MSGVRYLRAFILIKILNQVFFVDAWPYMDSVAASQKRQTLVDLENKPFVADDVWTGAIRRYLSKANVLTFRVGELTRTAEASSREVDFKHLNILIHPLGKLDPDGTIAWCDDFARHASAVDPRILPHSP